MGTPMDKTTDGSVLGAQTMGKPRGKKTHRWPGVAKTQTRTHGETHIKEAGPSAATPLCGFLYMVLSMGTGSGIWNTRPAMGRFAYGFPYGCEQRALKHLSFCLWVSPWI